MIVSLNGVIQAPISSYTVSGSTITFAANLVTGDVINFIQILGDVLDLGVPSDNTVSTAKIVNGAVTSAKLASGVGGVTGITSSANATAMTITSAEKIGIGETSPLGLVHIKTADSGASASANADELIIEGSGNTGITIASGNDSGGNIFFADDGGVQQGKIQYDHDSNAMQFRANNTDRLKIHSNGVAAFNNGIALGVGLNNTASNVLDDYEEGTFTPAWSFGSGSVSYSAQTGIYTKVGRMVNFVAYLHTSGTSSPSGAAQITGLPFTVTGEFGGNVGILYRWDLANLLAVLQPRVSGTVIQFFIGNSNAEASQLQGSAFRDGNVKNVILISGSYAAA